MDRSAAAIQPAVSRGLSALALAALATGIGIAPPAGAKDWDVANCGAPYDTLRFAAEEGTWMSLDVHPSGDRIVFDLLGDLYVLPIEGGRAERLAGGVPWEIQPRWSPDGGKILFTSDRGGGENLWLMNADGTDARAITAETYRLPNNGVWHPSGEWVVAKKHFTSTRSMGAGELWMWRVPEGGDGVQLTKRKNDQMDAGEPCISPDGRYAYWSEDMSPGSSFAYNKDPNSRIYMIRRLDLETGEITNLVDVVGGAVRPEISPDGATLAFVRRVDDRSELSLFDFETGAIRPLWDGLSLDQQETWALFGVYPGFDWTPDGRSIVLWAQGGLWRVDVATGAPTSIPFRADVELAVAQPVRFSPDVSADTFPVKVIRWPQPDGRGGYLFQALGTLWRRAPGREPKALFDASSEFRFAPRVSPDGKRIAYVTWDDRTGGTVRTASIDGGKERTVFARPGHWVSAAWSPDGGSLVAQRGASDRYRGRLWDEDPGLWIAPADGKSEPRLVAREGTNPSFSADGERIRFLRRDGDRTVLSSVDLLGSDRRDHATSEHARELVLSPDEKWLAFEELWQTWVCPFPEQPGALDVSAKMKAVPVARLSRHGGGDLAWSGDSRTIYWELGPELFAADVDSVFAAAREAAAEKKAEAKAGKDEPAKDEPAGDEGEKAGDGDDPPKELPGTDVPLVNLGWDEPADVPATDLWITGATILPMDDLSRIENGVVHVVGNRIVAVGAADALAPPASAHVLDASGHTILPGFVDVHAHTGSSNQRVYAEQNWAFLANLAYGVTATHDPSNDTQMIFAQSELVRQGRLLGPRVWSTGTILYGAEGDFKTVIDSIEDADSAIRRTAAWGAFSVKSY
ncbi:MAG: PD40 domain-containing protein, partial [Gemmatimonadetes bacterium]|nr:PD40 domain-containing protein [Gemmatimonadota bacterium]